MTVFMMTVLLSGQQTECCSGSRRRKLYRELLGGSGELNVRHFFAFLGKARFIIEIKIKQGMCSGRQVIIAVNNFLVYFLKCASLCYCLCVHAAVE
jgi:hypothetical protein